MDRDGRLDRELLRIEKHFVLAKHEYLHVFSPDGHLLHQIRGKKKKVLIPNTVEVQGQVLTHNHPNDSELSGQDCFLFLHRGLLEIRAYGRLGAHVLRVDSPVPRAEVKIKDIKALFGVKASKANGGLRGPGLVAKVFGLVYEFEPREEI